MSNIIKSKYVYIHKDDKKIIDSNDKSEKLFMVHEERNVIQELEYGATCPSEQNTAFTEGLKATVIETTLSEEEEQIINQQADEIIAEAKIKASQILENAKLDSKKSIDLLYEEARKQGYDEGFKQGIAEVEVKKIELDELIQAQKEEFSSEIRDLEPQFVDIVSSLIEKITGIIVEDKKDIILYLIHNAMIHADSSKSYLIRASKDDFEFVMSKKDEISNIINEEITLDIILDNSLDKNQCLIETDSRIIDCSLDVQLSRLIQDLKLLSIQ